jgi:anti-anti-sigma factor
MVACLHGGTGSPSRARRCGTGAGHGRGRGRCPLDRLSGAARYRAGWAGGWRSSADHDDDDGDETSQAARFQHSAGRRRLARFEDRQAPPLKARLQPEHDAPSAAPSRLGPGGAFRAENVVGEAFGLAGKARPEVAERTGKQTGDLHLGDAKLLADLVLRHAAVLTQQHDLLLEHRKLAPVPGDRLHAEDVLEPGVFPAEPIGQADRADLAAHRRIQRKRLQYQFRLPGLADLSSADSTGRWRAQRLSACGRTAGSGVDPRAGHPEPAPATSAGHAAAIPTGHVWANADCGVDCELTSAQWLSARRGRDPRSVILDLTGLEFIDSSGLAAFARALQHARQAGFDLLLAAPQQQVLRMLALTRLIDVFAFHACVDEAAGIAGRVEVAMAAAGSPLLVAMT